MTIRRTCFTLRLPSETAALAQRIGARLGAGDCILLDGQIGAGKTHFARHLIQSRLLLPEDVPSPTFTLVQTYDADTVEIWHADLYRISNIDEIEELGLTDAFETAICLVEWPEMLGALTPDNALTINFSNVPDDEQTRNLILTWSDIKWSGILESLADD